MQRTAACEHPSTAALPSAFLQRAWLCVCPGVDTATGLPNGNKLTGRFQETLDTHMPYHYCDATFVTSTRLDRPTLFKSEVRKF